MAIDLARGLVGPRHDAGTREGPEGEARFLWVPVALIVFVLMVATYFVVRSLGLWAENDSAVLSNAIRGVGARAGLVPGAGEPPTYPNGYAYPAISNALLVFTGLNTQTLQQLVYPLLTAFLVLPAWALYRELTGSVRAAALATLLLFLQPEFLFVILRGSHERVLRFFMLLAFWLLVRSFRFQDQPGRFAAHVALFYLVAFGLVGTNVLFGLSFVFTLATAMVGAYLFGLWRRDLRDLTGNAPARLAAACIGIVVFAFLSVFYLFPPSTQSLQAVRDLVEGVGRVIVPPPAGEPVYNPYASIASGWTSLQVYFLISVSTYLLIVMSAPIWLWQAWNWLARRSSPTSTANWLAWLLFGAFAIQGALSILSDRSGMLGGNLQHRAFPSFAMVATPLFAAAFVQIRTPPWGRALVAATLACMATAAFLKATNEPSLSNKWTFYTQPELEALIWADTNNRGTAIWVGLDERLSAAYMMATGYSPNKNVWDIYQPKPNTRTFLVSDVTYLQSVRLSRPLPTLAGANRIYDNGAVQFYRLRPQTPYQR